MHAVGASIINNQIWFEIPKTLLHCVTDLVGKLLVCCKDIHSDCMLNKLSSKVIARIYLLVVCIDDVVL